MSTMRTCGRCRVAKPHDAQTFGTLRGKPMGRCRACISDATREAKARAPEKYLLTAKKAQARYRARHREALNAQAAERATTPEQVQYQRKWRQKNVDKSRAYTRKWQHANHVLTAAASAKRRAVVSGAEGSHSAADIQAQFNAQSGVCYYCSAPLTKFHADHKTPLSRGGSNGPENIVCACIRCNLSKGARTEAEFLERITSGLVPHFQKVG